MSTSPDLARLNELQTAATASTMRLGHLMLDALTPDLVGKLQALRDLGWWLAVEVSAGHDGAGRVCLTAVSPSGERELFASTVPGSPPRAH